MTSNEQGFCPMPTRFTAPPSQAVVQPPDAQAVYRTGLSWDGFLASSGSKGEDMRRIYGKIRIPAGLLLDLKAKAPLRIMAFGESWCPDVVHHFPIVAVFESLIENVEARYFKSDANGDLLASLSEDGKKSIPLILFLDESFREVARIRGRKPLAKEWMKQQIAGRDMKDILQEEKDAVAGRFIDQFLESFSMETWDELNACLRR